MHRLRLLPVLAGLLFVTLLPAAPVAAAEPVPIHLTVANIGNINIPACLNEYVVKLCLNRVEERARAALRSLRPEVLVLIEVLPDDWCTTSARAPDSVQNGAETNPFRSCFGPPAELSQVQRLLGRDYDYRCTLRFGWDCVAVRTDVARFTSPITTPPDPAGCDDGFTVNAIDVVVRDRPLRVLAGHPDSSNDGCRRAELQTLLDLAGTAPSVLAGDFNLDPYRESNTSARLWNSVVGPGKRYTAHNPLDGSGQAVLTSYPAEATQLIDPTGALTLPSVAADQLVAGARTIDLVGSDALEGPPCSVIRVDGGGGMDHRAVDCRLRFRAAAAPASVVPEVPVALLLPLAAVVLLAVAARRRDAVAG